MPGRKYSLPNSNYRYGFNGMEKDNDIEGEGNAYTTEYRIYDSRLGRWFSLDPVNENGFMESPYSENHDNPISFTDPEGDDPISGILDALVAFGLSAGEDYISARLNGMNNSDAIDEIGWWSAGWDALKAYGSSVIKPPGVGLAQKLYKFSKSKVGKVLVGTMDRLVTKVMSNVDRGVYNDEDGDFAIGNLLDADVLGKLLLESFEEELKAELQGAASGALKKKIDTKAAATSSGTVAASTGVVASGGGTGGRKSTDKGKQGEKAANAGKPGDRESYKGPVTGKNRISDKSTHKKVMEVKNVKKQGLNGQIKDGMGQARNTGRKYILIVNKGTKLSKPLQKAQSNKQLAIRRIKM
jgi:RHS repeat-associated protein